MRGDHIKVRRTFHKLPLYYHHGIEVDDGKVIHYGEGNLFGKKNAAVTVSTMEEFLKGGRKEVVDDEHSNKPDIIVKRAKSQVGKQNYNMMFNNCEHFAQWARTGKKTSAQVKTGTTGLASLALGVAAGAMLYKKMHEDTDIVERINLLLESSK